MRIYLLNPPFLPGFVRGGRWQGVVARSKTMYYPLWLAYATALLESEGHECRLVDAPASGWDRERVLADAAGYKPDLAVLDSNFSSLTNDQETAALLKERTRAITVLVGPPAATLTERILQEGGVDIVARLEYDFTLADLARALAEGKDPAGVTGISFAREGKIVSTPDRPYTTDADLDRIPFVSAVYRKHLDVKAYWLGHTLHPVVQVFTGRGCPNQCTFCSWTETLTGRAYRVRSISNVVDEFAYIIHEMPEVREVFIEDDTFTIDKRRVEAFCDELTARGLKIVWSCNARASLDYETMKLMKKAGCRLLDVGYESGSDLILKNIRKGVTKEQMRRFARDARRAGLMVLGDFVFGFPGETQETARETAAFAKELKPNYVQFAVATPMPGTAFYDYVAEHGHLLTDRLEDSLDAGGFQKCIISYPEFTTGDIQGHVDRALRDYYLSPAYVVMGLRNVLRRNGWHELKTMFSSAGVFFRYLGRKS